MLCPHCNQPMDNNRVGIRLSPLQAAIFDVIKASGDTGVTSQSIRTIVYENRRAPKLSAIKVHIWQINEVLQETEYMIICEQPEWRNWHWRLIKRCFLQPQQRKAL